MKVSRTGLSFDDRVAGIWCGLEESVRAAEDPDIAVAEFFQVSLQQLEAWRAAEGRQRCPGVTTRGHGCRNYVSSMIDYDPRVWAAREPEFCPTHRDAGEGMSTLGSRSQASAGRNDAAEDDADVQAR